MYSQEYGNLHSNITINSPRGNLLSQASLIIWDELPMANKAVWECADNLCQQIHDNTLPFGGTAFVGVGDFRQVAPVIPGGGPTATLEASVKSSPLWRHCLIRTLTIPIRSAADPEYTAFVDHIGEDTSGNRVELNLLQHVQNVDDVVDFLFPQNILASPQDCLSHAFLSPKNIFVDEFNDLILNKLHSERGQ